MAIAVTLPPLSAEERNVIARIVDAAPPLTPSTVAELSALLGRAS